MDLTRSTLLMLGELEDTTAEAAMKASRSDMDAVRTEPADMDGLEQVRHQ